MRVSLQTVIDQANSFESLNELSQRLEPRISFWGRRYLLAVRGERNSPPPIGEIPMRTLLVKACFLNRELLAMAKRIYKDPYDLRTESLLAACDQLSERITQIYKIDQENVRNSCLITRIATCFWYFFQDVWYLDEWESEKYCFEGHILHDPPPRRPRSPRMEIKESFTRSNVQYFFPGDPNAPTLDGKPIKCIVTLDEPPEMPAERTPTQAAFALRIYR